MLALAAGAAAKREEAVTELFQSRGDLRNRQPRLPGGIANMRLVPRKPKPPTCDDCYFRKNLLCALELNETCGTFRPNRPEGLVPPRQPVLLMRAPRWASRPA
jgi:ribosomal protein L34E